MTEMKFDVKLVPSADRDLDYYNAYEQKIILDAVSKFLGVDANVQTKRRKQLWQNPVAPWELRVGKYRAFYEIRG